jgi:hypothetical protein
MRHTTLSTTPMYVENSYTKSQGTNDCALMRIRSCVCEINHLLIFDKAQAGNIKLMIHLYRVIASSMQLDKLQTPLDANANTGPLCNHMNKYNSGVITETR